MVEKVITQSRNVVDFARYQQERRGDAAKALVASARCCRHCGAAMLEGESDDDCSSTFNVAVPRLRESIRMFCAE